MRKKRSAFESERERVSLNWWRRLRVSLTLVARHWAFTEYEGRFAMAFGDPIYGQRGSKHTNKFQAHLHGVEMWWCSVVSHMLKVRVVWLIIKTLYIQLKWVAARLVKDPTRVINEQLLPQLPALHCIRTTRLLSTVRNWETCLHTKILQKILQQIEIARYWYIIYR